MSRRITVHFSDEAAAAVTGQSNQSRFVDQAVREKVERDQRVAALNAVIAAAGAPSDTDRERVAEFGARVEAFKAARQHTAA